MDRAALVKTLTLTSRALAAGDLVQIYKYFAFDADAKRVMAYDDTIGIVAPCSITESFCVEGGTLLGLLRNSRAETADFSVEENDVIIKAARSTFKLPFFELKDFLFEEPEDAWDATLPLTPDLLLGLKACLITASSDAATQAALVGVSLNPGNKNVMLYSSDGDAISKYILDVKAKEIQDTYMLPKAFCEALLSITEELETTKGKVSINKDWVRATLDNNYVIYGRMIENDDPVDFAGMIKSTVTDEPEFVEAPKGMDHALSRARVLADPESAKTVITIEKGRMRLVTTTALGIARDTLAVAKHADVEANVSAALIQRSLGWCGEIAVFENCVAFKSDKLFVIISNME